MKTDKSLRSSLIALASHWRSEGEYWCGTPADARSQHCANELLKVLGLEADDHVKATEADHDALKKDFGISNHEPPDRNERWSSYTEFRRKEAKEFVKESMDELAGRGEWAKSDCVRPLDIVLMEKICWGYECGVEAGSAIALKGAKKAYKRGK